MNKKIMNKQKPIEHFLSYNQILVCFLIDSRHITAVKFKTT